MQNQQKFRKREGTNNYELLPELCYPGTSVRINFEFYNPRRDQSPRYSVKMLNLATGDGAEVGGKRETRVKVFSLTVAKKYAMMIRDYPPFLEKTGVIKGEH
jgi:hypothetical protein